MTKATDRSHALSADTEKTVEDVDPLPSLAFAEERQARILSLLADRGRIRNAELAGLLNVSEPTVRKDVGDLARQGMLHRTHGGVMALRPSFEPDLPARVATNVAAKTRIARACLSLIEPGDAIYLDGGSTVLRIAELLNEGDPPVGSRNLNVLTNAVAVAQTLAEQAGVRHTVLGGTYRPVGGCFVGPLTLADLAGFTVNNAFIGVTGMTEHGFTVADLSEAQVKKAAIERSRHVVVAMDHEKLGASDFAKVCDLDEVGTLVTDEATDYLREVCARFGIELIVAADSGD